MYPFIQPVHAILAFFVLGLLLIAVLNSLTGASKRKAFTAGDRKIALFALIATHLQFIVGLVLYFVSPLGQALLGNMKDADARLTSLEHPLTNLIAVVLITIGWSRHKRLADDPSKFKSFIIFYGLGLILLLSRIPWKLWFQGLN
jgi:uncharacterized membrane protein